MPNHLLLHLSIHLLLPEHLLIDDLLLFGGKDVLAHVCPTLNGCTWKNTSERLHANGGTWEGIERSRHLLNWNLRWNILGRQLRGNLYLLNLSLNLRNLRLGN